MKDCQCEQDYNKVNEFNLQILKSLIDLIIIVPNDKL